MGTTSQTGSVFCGTCGAEIQTNVSRSMLPPAPPRSDELTRPSRKRSHEHQRVALIAIAGLVVLAAIVFFLANSGGDDQLAEAAASPTVTYSPTYSPSATHTPKPEPEQGEPYKNPILIGDQGVGGGWKVEIVGFTQNATSAVLHENMFNDHPHAGNTIALVTLKVTRTKGTGDPYFGLNWQLVSTTGSRFREYSYSVLPNDLVDVGRIPKGVSATGTIAFEVPSGAKVGAVYISGAFFAVR